MVDRNQSGTDPAMIVTIDTEGDNLWAKPHEIQTRNARYLPRFQALCERFYLRPVYLTNWEMAEDPAYREFAVDVIARDKGEIGMHLHAWNSPPVVPLTSDDYIYQPYLTEYPATALGEKVHVMTARLEDYFQVKMVSHRAGRFGFNGTYAAALLREGYEVDCSVTPHISWQSTPGDPHQNGGPDYLSCPETPYWIDENDLTHPGHSHLLEVPVSIIQNPCLPRMLEAYDPSSRHSHLLARVLRRLYPHWIWMYPNGRNLRSMLTILASAEQSSRTCVELMLHSSELMPGGSPRFPNEQSIEKLYRDLERLFEASKGHFHAATLQDYRRVQLPPL